METHSDLLSKLILEKSVNVAAYQLGEFIQYLVDNTSVSFSVTYRGTSYTTIKFRGLF